MMSKFKLFLLSCFLIALSQNSLAQEPKVLKWETNFTKVSDLAKKEKKPILLFFHGSDWCPPCKLMQKEVFQNAEFVNFATEKILFLDIDFPSKIKLSKAQLKHNKDIEQRFVVKNGYEQGFPQVIIIDAKGKVLYQKKGYAGEGTQELNNAILSVLVN